MDSKFMMKLLLAVVCQVLMYSLSFPLTLAQPEGSIYIDCGSTASYQDNDTSIKWAPDDNYIASGTNFANVPNGNSEFSTLRYFNNSRAKNCYNLRPVYPDSPYLLRASFMYGSYDKLASTLPISFQMAIDETVVVTINITDASASYDFEYYYYTAANRNSTFLCLLPDATRSVPFISAIALRPAGSDDYGVLWPQYGTFSRTRYRINFGGSILVRYPDDTAERYWLPEGPNSTLLQSPAALQVLTTPETSFNFSLFTDHYDYAIKPPSKVMQTAISSTANITIQLGHEVYSTFHLNLYFAEKDANANATSRQFGIQLSGKHHGQPLSQTTENPGNDTYHTSSYYVDLISWDSSEFSSTIDSPTVMTIKLTPVPGTLMRPLLNGLEFYEELSTQGNISVIDQEVIAVEDIKQSLGLTDYGGDPCSPRPYEWVTCSSDTPPTILTINLFGYHLHGNIPSSFGKLKNLTDLSLANNDLTGIIPYDFALLGSLKTLHLENNNLTGIIPSYFSTLIELTELSVYNNDFSGDIPRTITDDNILTFMRGETKLIGGAARAYTLAEVVFATENFKTEIGKGGYGPVYYGKLLDGQEVAVKVLGNASFQGVVEFQNEVDLLSRVHHRHLVSLVGFCQDKNKQILIYEYMHNGSLCDHLQGKGEAMIAHETLDWKTRLSIALCAAQGLEYLHIGCQPSMIHRDVKCSNILILKKTNFAKVSDFGLSKLSPEDATHVSTVVKGTPGYLDPEYYTTRNLSTKSDVFSFGVVLLELVTGRLPIDPSLPNRNDWNICDWARASLEGGEINNFLDPIVKESQPDMDALWKVVDIAMRSVEPKPLHRPTMTEVVHSLRQAIDMEGGPLKDSPDVSSNNATLLIQSSQSTATSKLTSSAHFEITGPTPR